LALEGPVDEGGVRTRSQRRRDGITRRRSGEYARPASLHFVSSSPCLFVSQRQRIILHIPDGGHVLDALADELDVSDEHGRAGVHPLFVGDAHDAEPVVAGAFADTDAAADAGGEDLSATAGDGVETGRLEA